MIADRIINTFKESCVYKLCRLFVTAYAYSWPKQLAGAVTRCFNDSVIGRALARFTYKKPTYQNSVYQRTLNKISAWVSGITVRLRGFLERFISGSVLCGAVLGFVNNGLESRMRAIGFFGFWFFWTATVLGVIGIIGRGRAAVSFVLALGFFISALLAQKLAPALKNSFFVKLFTGLIE